MASVNRVTLIGNLGADPESRFAPSGDAICNIRLATTETWKDKNGQDRYTTEIRGDVMKMLGRKEDGAGEPAAPRQSADRRPQQPAQQSGGGFGDFSDDIPFARHATGAAWRAV